MAELQEDIITENINDPKPRLRDKDRARLDSIIVKMQQNKESDEAINLLVEDFKGKYAVADPSIPPSIKQLDFSKPLFKTLAQPESNNEVIQEQPTAPDYNQDLYAADATSAKITKPRERELINKAKEGQQAMFKELTNPENGSTRQRMIQERKYQEYQKNIPLSNSDQPKTESQLTAERLFPSDINPKEKDFPVTEDELTAQYASNLTDERSARKFFTKLGKEKPEKAKQIESSIYDVDMTARIADDPNGAQRLEKVLRNSKEIKNGYLKYDIENGLLFKPQNIYQSAVSGWKEKNKAFADFDLLTFGSKDEVIKEWEKRRAEHDPDKPIEIPEGKLAEYGRMAGNMPLKSLIAGGLTSAIPGAQGAVPIVSGAVGSLDAFRMSTGATFDQLYNELRDKGMPENEAYDKAISAASKSGFSDAAAAGITSALAARIGMRSLPKRALTQGYRAAAIDVAKKTASELPQSVIEGLGAGTTAALSQGYKNWIAQELGLRRQPDEGVAEQMEANLLFTLGLAAAVRLGKGLNPNKYKSLLNGLKEADENQVKNTLTEWVQSGKITEPEMQAAQKEIQQFKEIDSRIPQNVSEDARIEIQKKIKKRDELEAKLENEDKAFHPEIKENIKTIEEEINSLAKDRAKVDPKEKELNKLINSAIENDKLPGIFAEIAKSDPEGFMKFVADQALGRDEKGVIVPGTEADIEVRKNYGDEIVDKAIEMFPPQKTHPKLDLPEKQSASISVIRPEERTQPTETITIKPKDDAGSARNNSTNSESAETVGKENESGQPVAENEITASENMDSSEGGKKIGITHAEMDQTSRELGVDTYETDPETVAQWDQQAAERFQKDPQALNKLFDKLRKGDTPDKVETRMMVRYMADLKAKINKNPMSTELLDQYKRTRDLFNIAGREQGKQLRARQGVIPVEESLPDFMVREMDANEGAPLTDQQKETVVKEHADISKAQEEYDAKIAKLEAENAKLKADRKIKEQSKATKPGGPKDFKTDRKQIIEDIRAKLKKARGETSVVAVPYAKELIAIAPDVAKLVKNLVEEGVTKLEDIVKSIHAQLKDELPDIQEKDIHNIIAGEYSNKQSRNEISAQVHDLKTQAKLINKLESLQAGIVPKEDKKVRRRNQEIEKIRKQIKDLESEMGLDEPKKLQALKTRYKSEIQKLEEKLAKGDYKPDAKGEPIKLDKEAQDLKDKLITLKEDREKRILQKEYQNRTRLQKSKDTALELLNVPRTIMSSTDFSAPLRQGLIPTISHPGIASKAFVEMFKQAVSQKRFDRWFFDLRKTPEFKIMEDSGLYVADPHDIRLSAKEEQFMNNLAEKIPLIGKVIKGSERAYVSYLNKMRVDLFNNGMEAFESNGKTYENSPELYKALASWVNNSTGRGNLGPLEAAAPVLNSIFFSPRLIASRINLLNPAYYAKLPKEVRVSALKDMAKFIGFGLSILGISKLAGAEVETDPRSADFGKIKIGNTRYDIWGGFQQYIRVMTQLLSGEKKAATSGNITELSGKGAFGETRGDVLTRFGRGKLAPIPATIADFMTGRTVTGEEVTIPMELKKNLLPLITSDVQDAMKDQGVKSLFTVGIPASFGVGVQTYTPRPVSSKGKHGRTPREKRVKRSSKND